MKTIFLSLYYRVMCTKPTKIIQLALASLMLITIFSGAAKAQCSANNCTPLNETFGTTAGCGSTTSQSASSYTYMQNMTNQPSTAAPNDGYYAIRCNSGPSWQGGWETTASGVTDGSGTTDGNYLVVNAGYTGSTYGAYHPYEFYHRNVTQLCPGATYNISFKMANLSTYSSSPPKQPSACGYDSPVELSLYAMPSGSTVQPAATAVYNGSAGTLIKQTSATDWYCSSSGFQWKTFGGTFTVPAGQTSFDITLVSGYVNAAGNDFLIDDITVTYNSGAPSGFSCTPTPVTFMSFTAEKASQNVVLNWSTATEKNNDYFAVERSADGVHFEQIGTVKGNGTSNAINYYTFNDYSFHNGSIYYRLKQVDFDGKYEYSNIRAVNIDVTDPVIITNDPSSSQALISFYKKGEATFTITDMLGRVVYSGERAEHEAFIAINKSMLCCGFFIVKVRIGSEVISKKIVLN
jgi:hypothetical protein